MHEMALAQGILDIALRTAAENGAVRVGRIKVLVGQMTQVEPEALKFGFEALAAETIAAGAELDLTAVPLVGRCDDCGQEFTIRGCLFLCPRCQSGEVKIVSGRELRVEYVEVE
ncbi:MAG: hydrogenase maturation nickel metallochaperone HypA [Veillonellales bacterium]